MQAIQQSATILKRRKFFMVLPLLISPFLVALFFIFGGGKGNAQTGTTVGPTGMNLQLPDAHFKQKRDPDKLKLYETVTEDSMKWKSAVKNDPYRIDSGNINDMSFEHSHAMKDILEKAASQFPDKGFDKINTSTSAHKADDHELELKAKLDQLQQIVNAKPSLQNDQMKKGDINASKLDRIKLEMATKSLKPAEPADPDLIQLDRMLDKLMIIQHPDSTKGSSAEAKSKNSQTGEFQTLDGGNAATAIIPEKQMLVSGATIRIQLSEPVRIKGMEVPADQFLYGTAMLNNERLKIQITSIRVGNNIIPVALTAYDLDGMEGIYVPGSMSRDVSKQSLEQGINGLGVTAIDPSLGAQAASAGIQAAKTLLNRKVKLVEVSVSGGYQILLKNENK